MTMTFDIPADVHARVASIPDLGKRVELFLRREAELEELRGARFGTEARSIAQRAVSSAQRAALDGEKWEASFENLRRQHQEISDKL